MSKNKLVLSVIVLIIALMLSACGDGDNKKQNSMNGSNPDQQASATKNSKTPIENLGFELKAYDEATGKAGDMLFTKEPIYEKVLMNVYGGSFVEQRADDDDKGGSPQISFLLPLGTKLTAISSGTVFDIKELYSGDFSVQIDVGNPDIYVEMEHVTNVTVKKGDKIKAGDVVAEVSPHNSKNNAGLGLFEVGILHPSRTPDTLPEHWCFFQYLDPKVKSSIENKIKTFYKDWESYKGDESIYDEASMPVVGCYTLDPISDNNNYKVEG